MMFSKKGCIPESAAELVPPSDVIPPNHGSIVDQYFEDIDGLVNDYGTALSNLKSIVKRGLDPSSIAETEIIDFPYAEGGDRTHRREFEKYFRYCRDECMYVIMNAKNDAQIFAHAEEGDEHWNEIVASLASHKLLANPESEAKASTKRESQLFLDIFDAELLKMQAGNQLFERTKQLLETNPTSLLKVLSEITEGDRDQEEYRPLLTFLATNHFDPTEPSIVDVTLEVLEEMPEAYAKSFLGDLDQCFSNDTATATQAREKVDPDVLSWLDFIHANSSTNETATLPSGIFLGRRLETWPEPLRRLLLNDYKEVVSEMRATFNAALLPYKDPSIFYISGDEFAKMCQDREIRNKSRGGGTTRKRPGSSKRGGSRVTKAVKISQFVESGQEELPRLVQRISVLSKTANGFIEGVTVDATDEAGEDISDEALLGLKPVTNYLNEMSSDAQIQADLLTMLRSIIDEPRFNGADKMTDITISMNNGNGHNTKHNAWHLNPNKRSNLSVGDIARQTRIYYVILKDPSGATTIGLLNIDHKNSAEKLRGSFKVT